MEQRGGLVTRKDLADYPGSLAWGEPIAVSYRGLRVYTSPPPTSAFQLLASLAVAEGWPLGDMEHLGPDHLTVLAESIRDGPGTPTSSRDRKSTRLNSSHCALSRMPSSA